MFKIKIENELTGNFKERIFESIDSGNLWIESIKNSPVSWWGQSERESNSDEGMPDRILSTREISQEINGETVVETLYTLKADYIIEVVDISNQVSQDSQNKEDREFLANSDWKVLRHIREIKLGLETSITEEEYLSLETERQLRAKRIL